MPKAHQPIYIPALKAKSGEFGAVERLSPTAKERIIPLFDVLPVPIDWNTHSPAKPLEDHLDRICTKLRKCWGAQGPLLIDLFDLPLEERTSNGTHPVLHLFGRFKENDIPAIPITGFDRDVPYNAAIASAVAWAKGAVGIRLMVEDMALPAKLALPLSRLLSTLNARPERSFVLLDFRGLPEDGMTQASENALATIRAIARLAKWRHTALLASGMPDGMGSIKPNSQAHVPRTELALWRNVIARRPTIKPFYGDYGVVNPEFMEPRDPKTMKPSAKIRYTLEDEWFIIKGSSYRKNPGQFRSLASTLTKRQEYCGPAFSWGDAHISNCQKSAGKIGNLETWVRADTSHHLEYVSEQIATLLSL